MRIILCAYSNYIIHALLTDVHCGVVGSSQGPVVGWVRCFGGVVRSGEVLSPLGGCPELIPGSH